MSGDTTTVDIQGHSEHLFQDVIVPLNERMMGPLDHSATQITPMPMVFVLGNHSSGKSSFLNYVIGRDVQTEGLAPTDDGFTVIAPGHEDVDQDGPAMIGDPDLGCVLAWILLTCLHAHTNTHARTHTLAHPPAHKHTNTPDACVPTMPCFLPCAGTRDCVRLARTLSTTLR